MPERTTIASDYIIAPEFFDAAGIRLEADGFVTDGRNLVFADSRLGLRGLTEYGRTLLPLIELVKVRGRNHIARFAE